MAYADQLAVDRLKKALVKRKNTGDRAGRLVEFTAKGRELITKTFRQHAAAMDESAGGPHKRGAADLAAAP